jgi:hypothetical protein
MRKRAVAISPRATDGAEPREDWASAGAEMAAAQKRALAINTPEALWLIILRLDTTQV